jgi:histidinol-phosphate aminotransferase
MSKSRSLAGLRVGYAIGDTTLINGLIRIKNSFNSYPLDRIAQKASVTSFQEEKYFNETCKKIIETRNRFIKALENLQFSVLPSGGNFIFAQPPSPLSANTIYSQLRDVGILVRYFNQPEKLKNFLRITIGTDQQMDLFVDELKKIINQ